MICVPAKYPPPKWFGWIVPEFLSEVSGAFLRVCLDVQ